MRLCREEHHRAALKCPRAKWGMSRRRCIISVHAMNRSRAPVAPFPVRRWFCSAQPRSVSPHRFSSATRFSVATRLLFSESIGRPFRRRGSDSPNYFRSAQYTRAVCAHCLQPRIHGISTGEDMKYLLLIAAMLAVTGATSISSSDANCCSGGACCPAACCMMMNH